MSRVLVTGWPRVGKTTFAVKLGVELGIPVQHTDDVIHLGWGADSLEVSTWFENPGPMLVEGVSVARSLRKWLDRNVEGIPADVLYWRSEPYETLTPRQSGMGKGIDKVWNEVRDELVRRGMRVEQF